MNLPENSTSLDSNQQVCLFLEGDLPEVNGEIKETMRNFFSTYIESSRRFISNRKVHSLLKISTYKVEVVNSFIKSDDYVPTSSPLIKSPWFVHISKLTLSLNSLLDHFKSLGIDFDDLRLSTRDFIPVFELQQSDDKKYISYCGLACSYTFASIVRMLQDFSQGPISIPINALLSTVARCFLPSMQKMNPVNSQLALLLKVVQRSALNLLDHLVRIAQNNLAIYSHQIDTILVKALDNSRIELKAKSSQNCFQNIYSLKQRVYYSIALWFQTVGPNLSVGELWATRLLNHFYNDIKQEEDIVELRQTKSQESFEVKTICSNQEIMDRFYASCLSATSNFLRQAIISLPEQEIQKAATFFLDECLSVFQPFSRRAVYTSPISRKSLLDIIITLVQHNESVPLTVAINVLTKFLAIEKDVEVKNHSLNALIYLNSYVNPKRHVRVISERSGFDLLPTKAPLTNNSVKKMTTIIENIGPVSAENPTPNSKTPLREPVQNEVSDCLVVEESLSHSRNENLSDISMVVHTPNSTYSSNLDGLSDVSSPASKSIGLPESNGDTSQTSIKTHANISHNSSVTTSSNNIQDAPKGKSPSSFNRDPRLSKGRNSVNLIDLDQPEDEDEDIFTIELPKSIIQSAKRPRMENNLSNEAIVRDSPEMEDIINDFYKN